MELVRRNIQVSPLCPMYEAQNETLEHLLFTCPLARAIWFGIDLSIRMDQIDLITVNEWIKDWLMKEELVKNEALWFQGQFRCTIGASGFIETTRSSRTLIQIPSPSLDTIKSFLVDFKSHQLPE
ncbi:hypothetical protein PTKIN_Ptkin01aG0309800 [Pterospermum kingtungense]